MGFFRVAAVGIVLCLATSTLHAQKQLALLATVSSQFGNDVPLTARDVEVTEAGKPIAVSKLELVPRVPKIQVLIDNGSGIPSTSLGDLRNGLKGFLQQLPSNVEVALFTTAPQGRTLEKSTSDRVKLQAAIDRLTPDAGTGRFVESLYEAVNRVDQDKDENAAYVIVNIASSAGEMNFRESDVKTISEKVQKRHPTVYTIFFNSMSSASLGGVQTDLGKGLADMTGGHFDSISVANRLVTLLPELGAALTKTLGPQAKLLRIMADRTAGGQIGQIGINIKGLDVVHLTLDVSRTK